MATRSIAAALAACALALPAFAQEPDPGLVERAKKEGQLVYYTDLIVNQIVVPLEQAFLKKYGIRVRYTRADSDANSLKLLSEHKAGRIQGDGFSMATGFSSMVRAGIVRKAELRNAAALMPQFRDPDGYWVSSNYYVLTPGVNTELVPVAERPKTYDDLLHPRWRGKMAWKPNDMSGAPGFIGNVLVSMGDEKGLAYLEKLRGQQVTNLPGSARAVLDRSIAGEYPLVLQIFNHHAAISAQKGAPAGWIPMEPATVVTELLGLTVGSPNPNAGQLFVEFMISEEGQKMFRDAGYFPTRAGLASQFPDLEPSTGKFKANIITPKDIDESYPRWAEIYAKMFR